MALINSVDDELKELRKQKREILKQEKALKREKTLETKMDDWQKIVETREACKKIFRAAKLGNRMTLSKLDSFPNYYTYQHPFNKKLKTDNRDEYWVLEYIGEKPMGPTGGVQGDEADLIATARKSRLAAWTRANKKQKRISRVLAKSSKIMANTGKAKAVGSVGVG